MSLPSANFGLPTPSVIEGVPQPDTAPPPAPAPLAESANAIVTLAEHQHLGSVAPEPDLVIESERVELDRKDSEGNTRLHNACKEGNAKTVKLLLACGADLNVRNAEFKTPVDLAFALPLERLEAIMIEVVATRPAAIELFHVGAVRYGRLDLLKCLHPSPAMICEAFDVGTAEAAWFLRKHRISPDWPLDELGNTHLHQACRAGNADQVRFLILSGANVGVANELGQQPFRLVFDDEIPEERQYAVLRELARADDTMASLIVAHAAECKRWDIPALMMVEGIVNATHFIPGLGKIPKDLPLCLDAMFRVALKSSDETLMRNCVDVLCHIIAWPMGAATASNARSMLRGLYGAAGEIVREAYGDCACKMQGHWMLGIFDHEISR
jgi:hypothetical protein